MQCLLLWKLFRTYRVVLGFLIYPFGDEESRTAHSSIFISWISPLTVMFVLSCTSPNMWFPFWQTLLPPALKQRILGTRYCNPKIPPQSGDFTLESGESSLFYVWSWDLFCLWVTLHVSTLQISSSVVFHVISIIRIFCSSSHSTLIFVTLSNSVSSSVSVTSVLQPLMHTLTCIPGPSSLCSDCLKVLGDGLCQVPSGSSSAPSPLQQAFPCSS